MSKLIKWSELSRTLSGSEQSVRPNSIPAKYKKQVESLMKTVKDWEDSLKENKL